MFYVCLKSSHRHRLDAGVIETLGDPRGSGGRLVRSNVGLEGLVDDKVVQVLAQAWHGNDTDNALGAPDADREATTVHGVLLIIADLERRLNGAPLLAELGAHVETGAAESQHGALLALDPVLVVEVGAGARQRVEKDLLVCQRDVDGHGLRVLEAALADQGSELKGNVGVKGGENCLLLVLVKDIKLK